MEHFSFASSVASAAKPIELSLGLIVPPKHLRYTNVIEPWMKMIEERTKGAVKINPYFNMTLAPAAQLFDATVKGLADISESYTFDPPGKFTDNANPDAPGNRVQDEHQLLARVMAPLQDIS